MAVERQARSPSFLISPKTYGLNSHDIYYTLHVVFLETKITCQGPHRLEPCNSFKPRQIHRLVELDYFVPRNLAKFTDLGTPKKVVF